MSNYIKLVQNQAELTAFKASNDYVTPNITLVYDNYTIDYNPYDYSRDYLTFVAEENGTFKFIGNNVNYSVDNGETWTTLASNTNSPTVQAGNKIMWKAVLTPTSDGIGRFSSTASFTAEGNVMSLLYGDDFVGQKDLTGNDSAFYDLFRDCSKITYVTNLNLPATTLSYGCYERMFWGCTSLTTAPSILPATILAAACYSTMFYGCTSLTTVPELPGTTLASNCYASMFQGCTSLTTAPTLPATTLESYCYQSMFYNCTSLTTAPVLPAATLANSCYNNMFRGCTKLNNITCLATNISETYCTKDWVSGVAATGIFIKADSMSSWTTGNNGIPSGWVSADFVEDGLILNANSVSITYGQQYVLPTLFNLNNLPLTYSSSNTNVATVNNNGEITLTGYGTTTISIIFDGNNDYEARTLTYTLTYQKANINPSVSISNWTYGETASNPSVSGNIENGTVTYTYSDDNLTWSSTQPTNAGTYYIKATIASTTNYNSGECTNTFTIAKVNINPTVSISNWTYGETASIPNVSGNIENGIVTYTYSNDNTNWSSTQPTNAGTYYIKATIASTTNYNGAECTNIFTIAKANINPTVSISNWTYGETASNPSVSGNSGGGSITYTYSSDNSTWSYTQPTNAGTYYIKATIASTSNYNGAECTNTFTIAKANINPTVSISDWDYGGTASTPSVSGNIENGTVTYTYSSDNLTWSSTQPTNAGTYYIKATITSTSNYNGAECIGTFKIFDFAAEYLTFVAQESGTFRMRFKMSGDSVDYSLDNGTTWTTLASNANSPTISAGSKILWKATLVPQVDEGIGKFSSTGRFVAKGNPMSLLYGDNFSGQTDLTGKNNTFYGLFSGCTGLTSAENLSLPATTLESYCYQNMFHGCTSLTTAPVLPATTLANNCYMYMFKECTSLTTTPVLPATTLASSCYSNMFNGCTSLTTAPTLPATTLAEGCYQYMFSGCTSLTTTPTLPATTLTARCYYYMFSNCTSLTTAPELPATTLANYCYHSMFRYCTSLTTAPELPAITLAIYCYGAMFSGCTSLTTAPEIPKNMNGEISYDNYPTMIEQYPLPSNCLRSMFSGCSSLNKIMFNSWGSLGSGYSDNWVNGVAETGDFYTYYKATVNTTGNNTIPSTWTFHYYSRDPI